MQMKYLSLAIAAAVATTGLTACGSDSHDYWTPPATGEQTPNTPDAQKPDAQKPDAEKPDAEKPDAEKPDAQKPDADKKPDVTPPNVANTDDNVGGAAEAFDISAKSSVVGQQYIRGSNSNFDKTEQTNAKASNDGNITVLGAEELQNKQMTNIVVAQYPDSSNLNADGTPRYVKYLLGEKPNANPNVNDADSIQTNNDSALVSGNGSGIVPFVVVTKDVDGNFQSYNEESKYSSKNSRLTQVDTLTGAAGKNDVRVFGKLSGTDDNLNNSAAYFNSANNKVDFGSKNQFKVTPVKLNNVQYGRVTGALDGLTAANIRDKAYIQAKFADKTFTGNGDQTDIYFYRGLKETAIADMPETGTFQYVGHALMYGIDNSYTGETDNGLSNSVAFGSNSEALGNFVKATYNASNKTVEGSVYNIWDTDIAKTTDALKSVDLVTFNGKVTGNTVKGSATRTYLPGDATFKGSFYGSKAAELGGSFNSITDKYGKSEWGGVFGAQKVVAPTTPDQPTFVPPINAVE